MNAIPAQDRALIEAALAAGRVTVVPRGVSSYPVPVWCHKTNRLTYPDGATQFRAVQAAHWRGRRGGRAPHPDIVARRDLIAALHGQGRTVAEIVDATGHEEHIVRMDLAKLDLRCNRAPTPSARAAVGRRDRVRAMAAEGKGAAEIAAAERCSVDLVCRIGRQLSLNLPHPEAVARAGRIKALDDAVAGLVREGLSKQAIRARLGLSGEALRLSLRRQRLDAPKAGVGGHVSASAAERAERVRALAAQGMTRRAIAREMGMHSDSVRDIGRRHGFDIPTGRPGPGRPAGSGSGPAQRPRPAEDLRCRIGVLYDQGLSWRAIADAVGITSGTVGYHLQMLGKAKVRNRQVAA